MEKQTLSIKEQAERDYDSGIRAGPSKQVGNSRKEQIAGLEYHSLLKQMLMDSLPPESRRCVERGQPIPKVVRVQELCQKAVEASDVATVTKELPSSSIALTVPEPVKVVPEKETPPTVTPPSWTMEMAPLNFAPRSSIRVVESKKRPRKFKFQPSEEKINAVIVADLIDGGFTRINCPIPIKIMDQRGNSFPLTFMGFKTTEAIEADGTKVKIQRLLMKY